jgi:molybdopterin/thiamine biosynthesis adenylyltransferase
MTHAAIGTSRVECAARRLTELNPRVEIVAVAENIGVGNAARLVGMADMVVDCAPLFTERLLLNEQTVKQCKPLIECAMFEFTAQVTTTLPGQTACLACRTPEPPPHWTRDFPVFGAVSGLAGCLGAVEAIKLICGVGELLLDRLLTIDLREMRMHTIRTARNPRCRVCR